ncbi:MAG: saccharopine dehydrogenase family protein [Solirubrobacterales bacterium]
MTEERPLDLVLFGATGFVGRLTAEYLARDGGDARIALAGRSQERLEAVKDALGDPAASWPLIVVDADDSGGLAEMAGATRVVATTVGPYRHRGIPLVEACAAAGTHYADLTGEVLFMRECIDRFDGAAKASGARIVHTCGFDSIPSDLGVLLLHQAADSDGEDGLEEVGLIVKAVKGGLSGGTFDSLKGELDDARTDPEQGRVLDDPYALSPDRDAEPDLAEQDDLRGVRRDPLSGAWLGAFPMAPINTRVVRRSNALQDWAYGPRLRYWEAMGFGSGLASPVLAGATSGAVWALNAGLANPVTRKVLDRVMPDAGEGPSERLRRNGFFRIEIHAAASSGAGYVCRVAAKGDPGYAATAVMLGQSALSLRLDEPPSSTPAGVLTPATAMGGALVDRLRAAGFTFEVERTGVPRPERRLAGAAAPG